MFSCLLSVCGRLTLFLDSVYSTSSPAWVTSQFLQPRQASGEVLRRHFRLGLVVVFQIYYWYGYLVISRRLLRHVPEEHPFGIIPREMRGRYISESSVFLVLFHVDL
jgi:hypothetical protein